MVAFWYAAFHAPSSERRMFDCCGREDREMKIELDNDGGIVEFDGKHMFVVRDGVRIAKRENRKWVSLIFGITVRDTKDKRHPGIEIIYSGATH
jgi:hypothetical protein